MIPYLEGYARARETELRLAMEARRVPDEAGYARAGIRHRVGLRLVNLGAQLLGARVSLVEGCPPPSRAA